MSKFSGSPDCIACIKPVTNTQHAPHPFEDLAVVFDFADHVVREGEVDDGVGVVDEGVVALGAPLGRGGEVALLPDQGRVVLLHEVAARVAAIQERPAADRTLRVIGVDVSGGGDGVVVVVGVVAVAVGDAGVVDASGGGDDTVIVVGFVAVVVDACSGGDDVVVVVVAAGVSDTDLVFVGVGGDVAGVVGGGIDIAVVVGSRVDDVAAAAAVVSSDGVVAGSGFAFYAALALGNGDDDVVLGGVFAVIDGVVDDGVFVVVCRLAGDARLEGVFSGLVRNDASLSGITISLLRPQCELKLCM